jgi:citrate lyase subunit beta / citryl-CoA lyase
MTAIRPRRSVLYMPGSNARALEKARTLPADTLILDLEDAVAPEAKATAREQVCAAVGAGGYGSRELVIRINGLETPWGEGDLASAAAAGPGAILVPKVSSPEALVAVGIRLRRLGAPELMTSLAAARAHELDIVDGVYNALGDEAGFRAECEQARDLGFDGKTLVHPNQIATANEIFAPAPDEVERAQAIIALFDRPENAAKGAVAMEGRMVERLHAEMARRTVAMAEAIAGR